MTGEGVVCMKARLRIRSRFSWVQSEWRIMSFHLQIYFFPSQEEMLRILLSLILTICI